MPTRLDSIALPRPAAASVLACGAYLKNRACLIDGDRAFWSPLHGDLGEASSREALEVSLSAMLKMAGHRIDAVAHDRHPDFHSSRIALDIAASLGVPALAVQHHHAHIGVVLAEQGITGPVLGLALDGFGLGQDGQPWGGELLWVDADSAAPGWRRIDNLAPLALPGGDRAAREPWRLAAAVLHATGRADQIERRFAPLVGAQATRVLRSMLDRGLNCPTSSAAGRWFDAAAGALALSLRQAHEAEAAIALEGCAREWLQSNPDFSVAWTSLDLHPLVAELFALADRGRDAQARGAAMFHLGLAGALATRTVAAAHALRVRNVVLAGGCMANRVLTERLRSALGAAGLKVFEPQGAGCGDAGLALGQAWIAASRRGAVAEDGLATQPVNGTVSPEN